MNISKKRKRQLAFEPYLFLLPVIISMIALFGYPLINSFIMAFKNYKLTEPNNIHFNGIQNFINLFGGDEYLGMIALNSIKWVLISVISQFLLGLILALALRKPFKGKGIYQSIIFLPWAFSSFAVGLMYRWSFNGEYGVINDLLLKFGIINEKLAWLGDSNLALFTVIIAMVWIGVPFFGIMYLAALQSIPSEIYEAADMDGCGPIRKFFALTLPYIKPTIVITLLLRTIWVFNSIDLIVVMTGGGPAYSSSTLASYMYSRAYSTHDFGMASALGMVFMVALTLYALLFLKITKFEKAGDF